MEVAVRTQLIYHFAHTHGAFGHCDERNMPRLKIEKYIEWRESLIVETSRSKEAFKQHFFKKYGESHRNLPIWMLSELMSMGTMLTFYTGVSPESQRKVAAQFGMPDELLLSWLRSLYAARNICAHHSRFFSSPSIQKSRLKTWGCLGIGSGIRCGVCEQLDHAAV